MAVVSFLEIIGRSFSHRFGEGPTAERKFAVTLDSPDTGHQEILDAIGIKHGSTHPEWGYLRCFEGSVSEGNPTPYHAEVAYRYEVPKSSTQDYKPNPLERPDVWSFSTGGSAVPATFYYYGNGNNDVRSLTNSAGDFFEGLMTDEGELRATIAGNRAQFPLDVAVAVTNCLNNATYLGAPKHSWKCNGMSAQRQVEVVDGSEVKYWSITVELAYRQSGWPLLIPNVGWNYIKDGKKERAYVTEKGEQVASSNPQPLNANGGLVTADPGESNPPMILTRRVHKEVDFATYFGTPTF